MSFRKLFYLSVCGGVEVFFAEKPSDDRMLHAEHLSNTRTSRYPIARYNRGRKDNLHARF